MANNKFILIVSAVYPPEPVVSGRLSEDLYYALKDRGCPVKVLHPKPTRPNGFNFFKEFQCGDYEIIVDSYTCPQSSLTGRLRESCSFGRACEKYIEEKKDDILKIYANTWPLFGQYYLAKAAKRNGIPYFVHIQDVYPESYCSKIPELLGKLLYTALLPIDKYVMRYSAGVIGISPSMISYLSDSRGIEKSKFTLVRNWQDDRQYVEKYKPLEKNSDVNKIMYVGSINPTANIPLIVNAVNKLDRSKYHLSVIGNGPDKDKCVKLAEQLCLDVSFETILPEEVAKRQSEADVLVLCLKKGVAKTATPSKLTAYMLSGRPIVASVDLDSDCASIIKDANCGIVVAPDDIQELSSAIKELTEKSKDELNKMGKASFEYAIANLSKERNLGILSNLLTKQ